MYMYRFSKLKTLLKTLQAYLNFNNIDIILMSLKS